MALEKEDRATIREILKEALVEIREAEAEASDGSEEGSGAEIKNRYYVSEQDIIALPTETLRDISSSTQEQFWLFSLGNFLVSGATWSAVQEWLKASPQTVELGQGFYFFTILAVTGLVIVIIASSQMVRRRNRVQKMIEHCTGRAA